jgi:hypothetical protein
MKVRILILCVISLSLSFTACTPDTTQLAAGSLETVTAQARTLEAFNNLTSSPTIQPTDTNLPTLASTATTNPYLLNDEFNNPNSGWSTFGDTSSGEVGYGNGSYRLAFYQLGFFNSSYSLGTYDDFIVETRVCTSATTPGIGAGLTLRASDYKWYLFWVYPSSHEYTFLKGISDPVTGSYQATDLLPRTSSDVIQPINSGDKLCFSIKAAAHGDAFDFWVAGDDGTYQYLASAHDSELAAGHLGPSADAPKSVFSPAPVEALFDWIKVYPYSN